MLGHDAHRGHRGSGRGDWVFDVVLIVHLSWLGGGLDRGEPGSHRFDHIRPYSVADRFLAPGHTGWCVQLVEIAKFVP